MKKKLTIAFVSSTAFTIDAFVLNHIEKLSSNYNLLIICNDAKSLKKKVPQNVILHNLDFKRKPNLQLIRVGWAVMPLAATWMALSTNLNKLEEKEKGTKKYVYSWVLVGIFLIAYLIFVR